MTTPAPVPLYDLRHREPGGEWLTVVENVTHTEAVARINGAGEWQLRVARPKVRDRQPCLPGMDGD